MNRKIVSSLLITSMMLSSGASAAPADNQTLPAGMLLHEVEDITGMSEFSAASQIDAGTYYMTSDHNYKGTVKYKKNAVIYGQGYTYNHIGNGSLWNCDTGSATEFYDMVIDGNGGEFSDDIFNADIKKSTWTFDNVTVKNYNAAGNSLFRLGTSSTSTLELSNFNAEENNLMYTIEMSGSAGATVKLGENVSIPDIYVSEDNSSLIFESDFYGEVGIYANGSYAVATVESGADITGVTILNDGYSLELTDGTLYAIAPEAESTPAPTATPEPDAFLYAVYTTDGTDEGELSRAKILSGTGGTSVSVPPEALSARKISNTDGTFDVYRCIDGADENITLEQGDNIVYITVERENGRFYFWEDFEDRELGDMPSEEFWYHGGASSNSAFIRCTTDSYNSSTAARWYTNDAGGSREKSFGFIDEKVEIPEGEKLVFSANVRISQSASSNYAHRLRFYSSSDEELLMLMNYKSLKTDLYVKGEETGNRITFPSVNGTDEETGSSKALSKWFNVKIEFDPSKTEDNALITIAPCNEDDTLNVNGEAVSYYSFNATSAVNAITQLNVHLARGSAATIIDNVKIYNTSAEYASPAKTELMTAMELYGERDLDRYLTDNTESYKAAVTNAEAVLGEENPSNTECKAVKDELIKAANSLIEKSEVSGERILVNENYDWVFIKEKECQSNAEEIPQFTPEEMPLSGWSRVDVPHTWNNKDGADGIKGYDRGNGWYRKSIYVDSEYEGKSIFLEFEGAAYKTRLYINGVAVPFAYDDPYLTADAEGIEYIHRGGFSTFRYDITDYVSYGEANTVAVVVDNTQSLETLPLGGDFSKEGGIYRDVTMVVTNPVHIDMLDNGSEGMYFTPQKVTAVTDTENEDFNLNVATKIVNDGSVDKTVTIEAQLREPDSFEVPDNEYIKEHLLFNPEDMYTPGGRTVKEFEKKTVTIKAGESYDYNETELIEAPRLWNGMEDPYMYEVNVKVYDGETLVEDKCDTVGFRYFNAPTPSSSSSDGGFYLNGKQYLLKGVGKHQDWGRAEDALGIAVTDRERIADAGTMYELGTNAIRLVHYQHSRREIQLYDKLGFVVWSEPALCSVMVWKGAEAYPAFEKTTLNQFEAMIKQQYNSPSVIFWAFSNEISHILNDNGKQIESEYSFQESFEPLTVKMQETAKRLDPVRITTYATNSLRSPEAASDITGVNRYPYWYLENDSATKIMRNTYKNVKANNGGVAKAVALTEYGGAAVPGITQEYNADGSVPFLGTSESKITSNTTYQAYMHEKVWSELYQLRNGIWASFVWQMFDSANDCVDVNLGGMNTKGLVAYDHNTRKASYYMYKANWNEFEPFVYIVNTERSQRPDITTIIRAYSNAEECQLYINGEKYGEKITDSNPNDAVADETHVFMWYDVPLSGNDVIEVRGIENDTEVSSSVDTNGEVVFTTVFTETSVKSLTDKLTINEDTITLSGGVELVSVQSVIDRTAVTALPASVISVLDGNGNTVTDGYLSAGMYVRITGESGSYKDYKIVVDALDMTVSASSGDNASYVSDGNASTKWMAQGNDNEYIIIDLGKEHHLNKIDIHMGKEYPYEIQLSKDGTSYENAITALSEVKEMYYDNGYVTVNANGVLVIADYDEAGRLTSITIHKADTSDSAAVEAKESRKLMLWDGMDTMKPLCESITPVTEREKAYAITQNLDGMSARYIKITFADGVTPVVNEIDVFGWCFNNTGKYVIDEDNKSIYLGESTEEHDTPEVNTTLLMEGQADYTFVTLSDTGRVLADGDILKVRPVYGKEVDYTLYMGNKE